MFVVLVHFRVKKKIIPVEKTLEKQEKTKQKKTCIWITKMITYSMADTQMIHSINIQHINNLCPGREYNI